MIEDLEGCPRHGHLELDRQWGPLRRAVGAAPILLRLDKGVGKHTFYHKKKKRRNESTTSPDLLQVQERDQFFFN